MTKYVLTTAEIARIWGKSERTIRYWAQRGRLPAIKSGGHWRFPDAARPVSWVDLEKDPESDPWTARGFF